jgi:hypothetical protein
MLATIRDRRAAHTLALYRAKNRVKEELRRHNIKLQSLTAREIAVWAALYLEDNREELMEWAQATVAEWECQRRAKLKSNVQQPSPSESIASAVQMLGASARLAQASNRSVTVGPIRQRRMGD